jgi:hypothetical protein
MGIPEWAWRLTEGNGALVGDETAMLAGLGCSVPPPRCAQSPYYGLPSRWRKLARVTTRDTERPAPPTNRLS